MKGDLFMIFSIYSGYEVVNERARNFFTQRNQTTLHTCFILQNSSAAYLRTDVHAAFGQDGWFWPQIYYMRD